MEEAFSKACTILNIAFPFKATDWLPFKMLLIWISWLSPSFFHPCLFPFPYLLVWHPDFYIIFCHLLYASVNLISPPGSETDCSSSQWLPWIGAFLSPLFNLWYICTCPRFSAASQTLLSYFLVLCNAKYVLSPLFNFLQFATYDSNSMHSVTLLRSAFLLPLLPFSFTIMLAFVHKGYCNCITLNVEVASPHEVSVHIY